MTPRYLYDWTLVTVLDVIVLLGWCILMMRGEDVAMMWGLGKSIMVSLESLKSVAVRPFESATYLLHHILQSIVCVIECFAYGDKCTIVYKTCGEFVLPLYNVNKICIVECVE